MGGGTSTSIGTAEHLGDHWEPHLWGDPPGEDPWNAATATVTVRGMMVPWYASLCNNGYIVNEGEAAYFYAECEPQSRIIKCWHGYLVKPGEAIDVPRTVPHFFYVIGDKPLKLTFMGVKMSVCHGDRVAVPLSALAKPWMVTIRAKVLSYEGDICSVLCQEGTQMDIHNANQLFGIDADAKPGTPVEFNIRFPGRPEETAAEAQTTNPIPYDGPTPPPEPFADE